MHRKWIRARQLRNESTDAERRLWQHNSDAESALYTRRRRPVELAWSGWYDSIAEAVAMKKQVQGWRREKREVLIMSRYDLLPELAASPDPPPDTT